MQSYVDKKFVDVQVVTKDNIHDFKITDVVLPLPGKSISIPSDTIKTFFEEELKKFELSLDSFDSKHK